MFKYNLGDKVLYKHEEYKIDKRRYDDSLNDKEPFIIYSIKSGDKTILVDEQELSTTSKYTIKIIDNKNSDEYNYSVDTISLYTDQKPIFIGY